MKLLNLICFLLLVHTVSAQIVLKNRPLPKAGDTLFFYVDNLPTGIDLQNAGPDQRWDFTTLQSPFVRRAFWAEARKGLVGNRFNTADLVLKSNESAEGYYQLTSKGMQLVGIYGQDPFKIGIQEAIRFKPAVLIEEKSIRYQDLNQNTAGFREHFSAEKLPEEILNKLPVRPDSFRISLNSRRVDEVDAWGKMTIPGGYFDVLREKRTEHRILQLEVKVGSLPWQDFTHLFVDEGAYGDHQFVSYRFYSDLTSEPVATVFMDESEENIIRVQYRAEQTEASELLAGNIQPGVYAFPNPAIVNVRFEFIHLAPGKYELAILNVLGKEAWKEIFTVEGNHTEKVDISFLKKGTYLYRLTDQEGKVITTKRLLVVRP